LVIHSNLILPHPKPKTPIFPAKLTHFFRASFKRAASPFGFSRIDYETLEAFREEFFMRIFPESQIYVTCTAT